MMKNIFKTMNPSKILITCLLSISSLSFAQEVLTLENVMAIAYENSPSLKQSKLSLISSQARLAASRAAMKTQISLDANPFVFDNSREFDDFNQQWYNNQKFVSNGILKLIQPIVATDGTVSLTNTLGWQSNSKDDSDKQSSYSNNLQLKIDQPLFSYNQKKMDLEQLELNNEKAGLSYAIQKLNIEKSTTQMFYNLYQKQKDLEIANEELENQQKSFDIIKNKVDAGLSPQEEYWQAELNLANSKSKVYTAEVAQYNAEDELKQMIGMPLDKEILIMANIETKEVDIPLAEAIAYAKDQRMELRQAEIDIENSMFDLVVAKATNEFKGNVSVAVGLYGDNEKFGNIYSKGSLRDNESVSVGFEIPIYDWGERKERIKAAEATVESVELDMTIEYVDIEMNIRSIYRNLKNLLLQIEIAKISLKNAELTYDLNLEKYENGDLTGIDLSTYQTQLSNAKNSLTSSIIDYKMELLNMKIQTLWDFETQTSICPTDTYHY